MESGAGSSAIGRLVHFDGAAWVQNLNADIRYGRSCCHRQCDECWLKRRAFLHLHPNPFVSEFALRLWLRAMLAIDASGWAQACMTWALKDLEYERRVGCMK